MNTFLPRPFYLPSPRIPKYSILPFSYIIFSWQQGWAIRRAGEWMWRSISVLREVIDRPGKVMYIFACWGDELFVLILLSSFDYRRLCSMNYFRSETGVLGGALKGLSLTHLVWFCEKYWDDMNVRWRFPSWQWLVNKLKMRTVRMMMTRQLLKTTKWKQVCFCVPSQLTASLCWYCTMIFPMHHTLVHTNRGRAEGGTGVGGGGDEAPPPPPPPHLVHTFDFIHYPFQKTKCSQKHDIFKNFQYISSHAPGPPGLQLLTRSCSVPHFRTRTAAPDKGHCTKLLILTLKCTWSQKSWNLEHLWV